MQNITSGVGLFDLKINDLPNFTTRTKNGLRSINILKVKDLYSITKADLYKTRGIGSIGRKSIKDFCRAVGIRIIDGYNNNHLSA